MKFNPTDVFETVGASLQPSGKVNNVRLEAVSSPAASSGQFTPHDARRDGRVPCQQ